MGNEVGQVGGPIYVSDSGRKGLPWYAYLIGAVIALVVISRLGLLTLVTGKKGGLFSKEKDPAKEADKQTAKTIRAEARGATVASRAQAREDRQDRKDNRLAIKMLKKERKACRKAAKGVRRKHGARKKAKAACNDSYRQSVANMRAGMDAAEAAEANDDMDGDS